MALDDILKLYSVALFMIITPMISPTSENTISDIQEWIDAAGGTQWHISVLVIRYLDFIATHPLHSELHFHAALTFVCQFLGNENRDLFDTLLECGLARAQTGTSGALLTEDMDYPIDDHLDRSLNLLILSGVAEYVWTAKSDDASTRDRVFMRLVVRRTYESCKESLFRRQILFMRENPDTDFYCLLNFKAAYRASGCTLSETFLAWTRLGRFYRTRTEVAGGWRSTWSRFRMGPTTISTMAREKIFWIFPLRSTRADIQAGLRAIVNTLPVAADENTLDPEIQERVQALLRRTRDVVQIHCE
ncbi:hypothetical protein MVEN_00613400 [Mycena venus]|uniref:Uncharacterized protein n=1 Tax=Mycena venus TaxID=2733690 RepID=A0A8H6YK14_9AGAR|nr:hypothetical protein MVEN_00613400 [Mycena venus]